jgi:hypothetical protein
MLGDERNVGCDDEKLDGGGDRNADGGCETLGDDVMGGRDAMLGDGPKLECGVLLGAVDE